jgi:hypothetical protein
MTTSIGILSIATNRYIDYWMNMVESFSVNLPENNSHTFYVFTDQLEKVNLFKKKNPQLNIKVNQVEPMNFPDATLLRYEIYFNFKDILDEKVLMHLDADMLIRDARFMQLENSDFLGPEEIALVSHPGYWRPTGIQKLKLALTHPELLLRDIYTRIKLGGVGSWEANRASRAYVPRNLRKNYVCGGIWAAENAIFKGLCQELSLLTRKDLEMGKMPIWHDESFLNLWASKNRFKLLSPSFCYDPRYPQLKSIKNIVEAVNKNAT